MTSPVSSAPSVKGNYIGTDSTGTLARPNAGGGVRVERDAEHRVRVPLVVWGSHVTEGGIR
mgnify:CR=1 FL=1